MMKCPDCKTAINPFMDSCSKCGWTEKKRSEERNGSCSLDWVTPEKARYSLEHWTDWQPEYDIDAIAKGLIMFGSRSLYWKKAKESERQRAKELYNEGYRYKPALKEMI